MTTRFYVKSMTLVTLGIFCLTYLRTACCFTTLLTPPQYQSSATTTVLRAESSSSSSRRTLLARSVGYFGTTLVVTTREANAGSLLDEFGTDPKTIVQREDPSVTKAGSATKKAVSDIEPNLRSNYYYPTNKKRYLPRIKKCSDLIPLASRQIGDEDWTGVSEFANKIADDTVLPLKLYTSSLVGGGTNVKMSYTKTMMSCADDFESFQKALVRAVAKRDQVESSRALEGMATALQTYRVVAKLDGPDGGGDIPSVDEIRRSACRVQGRSFEKKIKERDARLSEAKS